MDIIEKLYKLQPEEVYGFAAFEAADAGVEHERDLAFAAWQLRAQPLADEAWGSYRQASRFDETLRSVYLRIEGTLPLEARVAFNGEMRESNAVTSAFFAAWGTLSKLARAEGRDDITPQQEADALATVAQMEELRVEKLLQQQARRRAEKAERAEEGT